MAIIGSNELKERTGATYRQIDYWTVQGIIHTVGHSRPGSGNYRQYDESIIPRVKLLADVSELFMHQVSTAVLKEIYNNFSRGKIRLSKNIYLTW